MNLLNLFKNRKPDEVWVTASIAQENFDISLWELFFLELEDGLGGQLDILDKNDPPRRPVLGQKPSELAEYLNRILANVGYTVVNGIRHHDNFELTINQSAEEKVVHTQLLLSRPYNGDIDDVLDWSDASLDALVRIFSPYVASIQLRSDSARVKNNGNYWIGRQIPRLAFKQYFGKTYSNLFFDKFSQLQIQVEPFHGGTLLYLSKRIDKVDQSLIEETQAVLAGHEILSAQPDKALIELL